MIVHGLVHIKKGSRREVLPTSFELLTIAHLETTTSTAVRDITTPIVPASTSLGSALFSIQLVRQTNRTTSEVLIHVTTFRSHNPAVQAISISTQRSFSFLLKPACSPILDAYSVQFVAIFATRTGPNARDIRKMHEVIV